MSNQLQTRRFNTLEDLAKGLQAALKQGKAIKFHNNNGAGGVKRHILSPSFDSIIFFHRGEGGLLLPYDPNQQKLENYSITGFYPYSDDFFRPNTKNKNIIVGGEQIINFSNHQPLTLRLNPSYINPQNLDSEEKGPQIGTIHTINKGHKYSKEHIATNDGLNFKAQEIYYLQQKTK
jgi:hypothetical protein